jgi:hypothetical protein
VEMLWVSVDSQHHQAQHPGKKWAPQERALGRPHLV